MKNFWTILIIGIIIRLFLAATTYHPDLQPFNLAGRVITEGNILNLYDYLPNLAEGNPFKNIVQFTYPPAVYLFNGLINFILGTILGLSVINQFLLDNPLNYGNVLLNLHLLILKLPYLFFDLSISIMLFKMFSSEKKSKLAFILWMFNPLNLYSTYMMGQFDIIPTFFTVLAVFMITKKKLELAALALGGGIAFKIFPIFLVIPLLILEKNFWGKAKIVALSFLPYILLIIPYIRSHGFRATALFANQNTKSLYANIPISGGEAILIFPAILLFFYLIIWVKKSQEDFWKLCLIPLTLFFTFTHYHPQWLVWLTPLLIIELVESRFRNIVPVGLIFVSFTASLFFFDPSLTVGIFAPLFPVLHTLPSIWVMLHLNPDYNATRSLIQTLLAAPALLLIYEYFPRKSNE